jgi:hypothetical protein
MVLGMSPVADDIGLPGKTMLSSVSGRHAIHEHRLAVEVNFSRPMNVSVGRTSPELAHAIEHLVVSGDLDAGLRGARRVGFDLRRASVSSQLLVPTRSIGSYSAFTHGLPDVELVNLPAFSRSTAGLSTAIDLTGPPAPSRCRRAREQIHVPLHAILRCLHCQDCGLD